MINEIVFMEQLGRLGWLNDQVFGILNMFKQNEAHILK
jgi:hypothetical protein